MPNICIFLRSAQFCKLISRPGPNSICRSFYLAFILNCLEYQMSAVCHRPIGQHSECQKVQNVQKYIWYTSPWLTSYSTLSELSCKSHTSGTPSRLKQMLKITVVANTIWPRSTYLNAVQWAIYNQMTNFSGKALEVTPVPTASFPFSPCLLI